MKKVVASNFLLSDQVSSQKEIYRLLKNCTASITTQYSEFRRSGCFISSSGDFITASHNLIDSRTEKLRTDIHLMMGDDLYPAYFDPSQEDLYLQTDVAVLRVPESYKLNVPFLELYPDFPLEEGEDVYFSGFPLSQEVPTVHKGTVSSCDNQDGLMTFTIDGTIVPGNSGGGVVVKFGNQLKVIGVLVTEIGDMTGNMPRVLAEFKAESERYKKTVPASNDFTSQSVRELDLIDRLVQPLELFLQNLSTGIGKAVHVSSLGQVLKCSGNALAGVDRGEELPVPRRTDKFPGAMAGNPRYIRWYHRHVKGKAVCAKYVGRIIKGGKDTITAEEELLLRPHYLKFIEKSVQRKKAREASEMERDSDVSASEDSKESDEEVPLEDRIKQINIKLSDLESGQVKTRAQGRLVNNLDKELRDLNQDSRDERISKLSKRLAPFLESTSTSTTVE